MGTVRLADFLTQTGMKVYRQNVSHGILYLTQFSLFTQLTIDHNFHDPAGRKLWVIPLWRDNQPW